MLPGMAPPQKPDVDVALAERGLPLDLAAPRRCRSGGRLLSGMSMIVVIPPAAAARVAVAKPSQSVRPGSLTWTWVSTMPGSKHLVVIELDGLLAREIGLQQLDRRHDAVAYPDTTRHLPRERDDSGSADHQVVIGHRFIRAARRPAQLPILAR